MSDEQLIREIARPQPGPWLVEAVDAHAIPLETVARVLGWSLRTAYRRLAAARET